MIGELRELKGLEVKFYLAPDEVSDDKDMVNGYLLYYRDIKDPVDTTLFFTRQEFDPSKVFRKIPTGGFLAQASESVRRQLQSGGQFSEDYGSVKIEIYRVYPRSLDFITAVLPLKERLSRFISRKRTTFSPS